MTAKMARFAPRQIATVASAVTVNAGALRSWRRAKRMSFISMRGCFFWIENSFGTQRLNGIDQGCATRWQQTGEKGDRGKNYRDGKHRRQIGCADAEKKALEQPSAGKHTNQTQKQTDADKTHSLADDQAQHVVTLRAESKTNSNFLSALSYRVTHHPENSGGRKEQRN